MITYNEFKNVCANFNISFNDIDGENGKTLAFIGGTTYDNRTIYLTFLFHKIGKIILTSTVKLKYIPNVLRDIVNDLNNNKEAYHYEIRGYDLFISDIVIPQQIQDSSHLMDLGLHLVEHLNLIIDKTDA